MYYPILRRLILGALLATLVAGVSAPTAPASVPGRTPRQEDKTAGETLYRVSPVLDGERGFAVQMQFAVSKDAARVRVQMPVWSPGDYAVQNHARSIRNFKAYAPNAQSEKEGVRALTVTRPDANTWEIQPAGAEEIVLSYRVGKSPPGNFGENTSVSERQSFFNGPAVYAYLADEKQRPARVEFLSEGRALTSLAPVKDNERAFTAPDYDTLADAPVLISAPDAFVMREFTHDGKPHRILFFGKNARRAQTDATLPVVQRVVEAATQLMGGAPYPRYDFLFDTGGREVGLEHQNACVISLNPEGDPRGYAPFFAHEYFHLWNVKRIRPRVLGPFDYSVPPRTRNLWFAEGVTEYYAHIITRRAALTSEAEFLDHWRFAIESLQRNPARRRVTADEASWRVWEEGRSRGYGGLSYYEKGELIGLCLDLKIRGITSNRRSLDDVMRLLMQRYAPPNPGYEEDALREIVSEVAGQDLSAFYDGLARSTQEMPFAECLSYAGLDVRLNTFPNPTPEQMTLYRSWTRSEPRKDKNHDSGSNFSPRSKRRHARARHAESPLAALAGVR